MAEFQAVLPNVVVTLNKATFVSLQEALASIDNRINVGKTADGKFCIVLFDPAGRVIGFVADEYHGPG